MTTETLKLIFLTDLTTLNSTQLEHLRCLSADQPESRAAKKVAREIASRQEDAKAFLAGYYANSVGGISIEKYSQAKTDGTLKVINL